MPRPIVDLIFELAPGAVLQTELRPVAGTGQWEARVTIEPASGNPAPMWQARDVGAGHALGHALQSLYCYLISPAGAWMRG